MIRGVLLAAGWALLLLCLGTAVLGAIVWMEVAPGLAQGDAGRLSAEIFLLAAIGFAATGLLCLGAAEVLHRLPQ